MNCDRCGKGWPERAVLVEFEPVPGALDTTPGRVCVECLGESAGILPTRKATGQAAAMATPRQMAEAVRMFGPEGGR